MTFTVVSDGRLDLDGSKDVPFPRNGTYGADLVCSYRIHVTMCGLKPLTVMSDGGDD